MARIHIAIRWLVSGSCASVLMAVLATGAAASTGGTSAGTGSVGQPAPAAVGATLGTITFAPATVAHDQKTVASGMLSPADAGQSVSLELEGQPGIWDVVATKTVAADGSFAISWRASVVGQFTARVVTGALASSFSSVSTPQTTLLVVKAAVATWYGPGLYGNHTACGEKLTKHILGVADRTLPCGTAITLFYGANIVTVPVIDRGPYANDATFDLTHATAEALGITETVHVGYIAERGKKIAATNWYAPGSTGPAGTTGASGTSGVSGASGSSGSGGAQAPS
jgi:uncharacterized membrane protein YgcG